MLHTQLDGVNVIGLLKSTGNNSSARKLHDDWRVQKFVKGHLRDLVRVNRHNTSSLAWFTGKSKHNKKKRRFT